MAIEAGVVLAAVGCFVGVAGWLSGRDKVIRETAEWRAKVDSKLEHILASLCRLDELDGLVRDCGDRVYSVEVLAARAHERIDSAQIH